MKEKLNLKSLIAILIIISVVALILLFSQKSFSENINGSEKINFESEMKIDINNWEFDKVDIVYDTEGIAVPVPKGYTASSIVGEKSERTVNKGFVIYEGEGEITTENVDEAAKTRNQWVWVPVADSSRMYEIDSNGKKKGILYSYSSDGRTQTIGSTYEPYVMINKQNEQSFAKFGLQGMTKDKLLQELEIEYEETIKSIEKYGGFYIGRYETGDFSKKELVVKKMNSNTSGSNQSWFSLYDKSQYLGANKNVKTNIIWGSLWDETLEWLVETKSKTYEQIGVNSTSWGNYQDSEFDYIDANGVERHKEKGQTVRIPTGSAEMTKANNIYDMAGNSRDRTLEADNQNMIGRGGDSGGTKTASARTAAGPDNVDGYFGARAYLYIK